MALSANTVFEVRTGGADTNGGGFVTGASGTDWSQQNAAQYAVTDGVTAGTTTITSVTANFGTDVVGNIIYVSGGTGTIVANWYQIISRTNATTIVVDRTTGLTAGTGVTLNIGGAFASPGILGNATLLGSNIALQKAWIKSGTYTLTSATDNISGGLLSIGSFAVGVLVEGYQTTRGDRAARPVITAGSVTGISNGIIRGGNSRSCKITNIELNGNSGTGNTAGAGAGPLFYLCLCRNFTAGGAFAFSGSMALRCAAISCSTGFGSGSFYYCMADTCGVGYGGASYPVGCIAKGCTTRGYEMSFTKPLNCIAYNCVDGYDWTASQGGASYTTNCIAYGNSGFGFKSGAFSGGHFTFNDAAGNNTSGNFSGTIDEGAITLTADPFTNAAGGDFSINNTAGGGALLRAAGLRFGDGLTYDQINYIDVGVFQHQDTGGSSGPVGQFKQFNRGTPY